MLRHIYRLVFSYVYILAKAFCFCLASSKAGLRNIIGEKKRTVALTQQLGKQRRFTSLHWRWGLSGINLATLQSCRIVRLSCAISYIYTPSLLRELIRLRKERASIRKQNASFTFQCVFHPFFSFSQSCDLFFVLLCVFYIKCIYSTLHTDKYIPTNAISICPILCQLRSADFVFVAQKKELAQRDGEGLFDKKARADIC